jgi:hypothetical protein
MTPQSFFNKWNGKYCEFNNDQYLFQCVDLARQYIKEVLGYPQASMPPAGYAKDIFKNFVGNDYFGKVPNGPYNAPRTGDIVFWGYYPFVTGWAGHVAICSTASTYGLVTFDQNWSNPSFCRYVNHKYRGVLGWLHPKKTIA